MVNENYKKCEYYTHQFCRDRYLADLCKLKPEPFDYGDCNEDCPLNKENKGVK